MGYKLEEKLHLGVSEQKRLNTTGVLNLELQILGLRPSMHMVCCKNKKAPFLP
jgi:hypothetical protein